MWTPAMPPNGNQWVTSTASLPVAFAQVREDPRIDRHLVEQLGRAARVLMIASGGETAALLATLPIESLHIVDPNPAQVALTRLKLSMLAGYSTEQRLKLLGHYQMDPAVRGGELQSKLADLGVAENELGPPELVAMLGPDFCARYEWVFARLRQCLLPHQHQIRHLMSQSHVQDQARSVAPGTELGQALEAAFDEVMELENLMAIFGGEATANRAMPFAKHFVTQTRAALSHFPALDNPFLHQLLLGHFAGPLWDWLELPAASELCPLQFRVGPMGDVIAELEDQSYDLIHLSNILDWIRPEQAQTLLAHAYRCLSDGGMVVIRQLNSTLDIPSLPSEFKWQVDMAGQLHEGDRSFFYRELHVGMRT